MTDPVSNSEISTYLRCRRKWYLTYVLWLQPRKEDEPATGVRQLGMRIHQALEADVKFGTADGPLSWLDQIYGAEKLARLDAVEDLNREHDMAKTMLSGYLEWAAENGIDEGIEVVGAETDVVTELPGMPGVSIRGRLDRVIRRISDGVILFRDWKTVGSLTQADALIRSPQMRFYAMLQRLSASDQDPRIDGGQVVYMLRSKRTARATPPFYHLEEIRYNKHDLNAAYIRAYHTIAEMTWARQKHAHGVDYREIAIPTPLDSCSWECPFLHMCPMMDDGSNWQAMALQVYEQGSPYAYYDREPGRPPENTS
jgi:RecB family exonuclease